jgi:excisionase family DNA binding protein
MDLTGVLRVSEAARQLDVDDNTIYRAIESGALVALRIGHGRGTLRIPKQAWAAYLAACEEAAKSSNPG